MKQFYFLNNSGELKTSIELKGDFAIAYSLRFWKSYDKVLELVEELRGSCFNHSTKEITYGISKSLEEECTYFFELDANISTINSTAKFYVKLKVGQGLPNGTTQFLGEEETSGIVAFNDGGKFSKLGVSLAPNELAKMAG